MLDTKLKKSPKKLKNLIIALIVLVPALVLVCLYPTMEKAMVDKRAEHLEEWNRSKEAYEEEKAAEEALKKQKEAEKSKAGEVTEEEASEIPAQIIDPEKLSEKEATTDTMASVAVSMEVSDTDYGLQGSFINYAVESSYYQYAMMRQDTTEEEICLDILEAYGWINDYYTFTDGAPYYVECGASEKEENEDDASADDSLNVQRGGEFVLSANDVAQIFANEKFSEEHLRDLSYQGCLGYLYMRYDRHGRLVDIRIEADESLQVVSDIYKIAKNSIDQYKNNVLYTEYEAENDTGDPLDVCPQDFRCIYLIMEDNEQFVYNQYRYYEDYSYDYYASEPYYSPDGLYFETGAYWIVLAFAVLVFAAAMILPFFKKLDTGREKLFSIPTEIALCLAWMGIWLAIGMCYLMSVTTMDYLKEQIVEYGYQVKLLGYTFSPKECYRILIVVNFLGWALAFFTEYICAAQLRQLFAGPKEYIKNRLLIVRLLRWCTGKCRQFWAYLTRIDIDAGLHQSILKIVLVDALLVMLLCCMWFVGAAGAIIYAVLLYLLLRKYAEKLQKQYQSILNATGQMADGNLQVTLEEDLGILEPLGEELCRVQEGFAKAVAEEAKSQNMKSELITNVSHDLKTPLTAIITYVDLLKNPDITEEERKSYIETLDLKSQRLKVLIEDLFEVSKANSGNVTMNFMDVDIVKLLKELRVEMSDKLEASDLDFRWNLPEEKVILSLDGQRTYRIFENLLNNALKYAMPHTRVYVDVVQEETEAVVTFKNMSAQELNFDAGRLTERFVRGDSSRNSEGSGLGLAIAKSFTELQNGKFEISVDGDLFKVTIRFLKK